MGDYISILRAAQQLSEDDRYRLIDALFEADNSGREQDESKLSEPWLREIDRRVDQLEAGTVTTIPWEEVKRKALARIADAKAN